MKIDRSKRPQIFRTSLLLLTSLVMSSCVTGPDGPDMGGIYSVLAQSEDPYRNPVILIPGTMGSRLVDPDERRRNALDHLQKSLHRDRQFTAALDVPASPPKGVALFLMAEDAIPTDAVASVNQQTGKIKVREQRAGDGRVLRSSALMDERSASNRQSRLISPIAWSSVQFLYEDHLGLTKDPVFADNLLYFLWERPAETRDEPWPEYRNDYPTLR